MRLSPGTVEGEHARLVRVLGRGGMGAVWLAEHLRLQTQVAVKVIAGEELRNDPKLRTRLLREAMAAAKIRSPHVVQILDHGETTDGTPYVVMELLEGESLGERLEHSGPVEVELAAAIVTQTARALRAAHRLGIVHRDIKPHNIFLLSSDDGEAFLKVLDFGIALHTGHGVTDQRLTATGQLLGTPPYMSPESVLHADPPGPALDAWALAVTAYEMLLDALPFVGDTLGATIVAITKGTHAPPSSLRPELGPEMDRWFAKAFHVDVEQRFTSLGEQAETFAELCQELAAPVPPKARASEPIGEQELRQVPEVVPDTDTELEALAPPVPSAPAVGDTDSQESQAASALAATVHSSADPLARETQRQVAGGAATFGGASAPSQRRPSGRRRWTAAVAATSAVMTVIAVAGWLALRDDEPAATSPAPSGSRSVASAATPPSSQPAPPTAPPDGMVAVPSKTYRIGCTPKVQPGCFSDEGPAHEVALPRFAIMHHEVSKADYGACVKAAACPPASTGEGCVFANRGGDDLPVNCVSWQGADRYCRYRGWRLPSEQEWEAAARGAEDPRYPWGDEAPSCERTVMRSGAGPGCGSGAVMPIGARKADRSWVGAVGMGGNVREWTASTYGAYPHGRAQPGRVGMVNRGGSFRESKSELGATYTRGVDPPGETRVGLGFRCAASL